MPSLLKLSITVPFRLLSFPRIECRGATRRWDAQESRLRRSQADRGFLFRRPKVMDLLHKSAAWFIGAAHKRGNACQKTNLAASWSTREGARGIAGRA